MLCNVCVYIVVIGRPHGEESVEILEWCRALVYRRKRRDVRASEARALYRLVDAFGSW